MSQPSYRQRNRPAGPRRKPGPAGPPPNALDAAERTEILTVLCERRFADKSVAQVWAELLDEGVYLDSQSTMYRILRAHNMTRERRRVGTRPPRVKPKLVAHQPNEQQHRAEPKLEYPTTHAPHKCSPYPLLVGIRPTNRDWVDQMRTVSKDPDPWVCLRHIHGH